MGNAATKESRPRSGSVASLNGSSNSSAPTSASTSYPRRPSSTASDNNNPSSSSHRRPSRSSVSASNDSHNRSSATNSSSNSSRSHHRSSKSKSKKQPDQPQHLVLDLSETVDGGYLQPQGVYTGPQDFKYKVVRQLIVCFIFFYIYFFKKQNLIHL